MEAARHSTRATAGIHDVEMMAGEVCAAVVFNDQARPAELLAFAKAQTRIADEFLAALSADDDFCKLAFALQGLLEPAMAAIDLAARKIAGEARQ